MSVCTASKIGSASGLVSYVKHDRKNGGKE
jgi:hypothetical protein